MFGLFPYHLDLFFSFFKGICPFPSNSLHLSTKFIFLKPYNKGPQGLGVELLHHLRKDVLDHFSLIFY